MSGGETSRSRMTGGETFCPKNQGVKRPGPKRVSPRSQGAKTLPEPSLRTEIYDCDSP